MIHEICASYEIEKRTCIEILFQSLQTLAIPVFLNYFVKNFLYNAYINVITSATIVEQTISINIL